MFQSTPPHRLSKQRSFHSSVEDVSGQNWDEWLVDSLLAVPDLASDQELTEFEGPADLTGTKLEGTNLNGINLQYVDLVLARLNYSQIKKANLRGADLCKASLHQADLRKTDLSLARLNQADMTSSNLRSANLKSADLSGADLRWADLRTADLTDCSCEKTKWAGALFDRKTKLPFSTKEALSHGMLFTNDPDGAPENPKA